MRILVVHSWLRGNLGDVLQASVLLRALRSLRPRSLDLAGYPRIPGEGARELVELADRHVPEPFAWYWRYTPASLRAVAVERRWRRQRAALFSRYDAIVSAPGPFLAHYDARCPGALCDIAVASDIGVPFILASHSIGPLSAQDIEQVRRTTLCVAREDASHEYLRQHGLPAVRSADFGFLYPYEDVLSSGGGVVRWPHPYRLVFLRSQNFRLHSIRWHRGQLLFGSHLVPISSSERVVVATSDPCRDEDFVVRLAEHLGVPAVVCRSVRELVSLIAGSSGVVSDRYHPAICAVALGKTAELLPNAEPHKMLGLENLLRRHDLSSLCELAREGVAAVTTALRSVPAATAGAG